MNNLNPLDIAEYIALAIFVCGSIVAAYSGQIMAAAIPLAVLMLLNIINRNEVEQLSRKSLTSISGVKDVVEQQVEELKTAMPTMNQDAQNPQSTQDLERLFSVMENLQDQMYYQRQSVEVMRSQIDSLLQQFNNRTESQHLDSRREALPNMSVTQSTPKGLGTANLQQSPKAPLANPENFNYAEPTQYQKAANSAPENNQNTAIDAPLQQRLNQVSPPSEAPLASRDNLHDTELKQYQRTACSASESSQKGT
ncbi:MAG TPA: hypothetical protein V6D12_06100, partial [Candidatus Obscuribacterales bacterium]